ncbi:hypothetical protein [Streptomyces werraensis]|uniref:hypothetical protein n=1 Tax=Streptomyces werraensis TaxID=68284 RepID=UPI00344446BC
MSEIHPLKQPFHRTGRGGPLGVEGCGAPVGDAAQGPGGGGGDGDLATDERGPAANWVDPQDAERWQAVLANLRTVLVPPPATVPLLDIERPA